MLPTASFSTWKLWVPTDSIFIAFSWLGFKSTVAADGEELAAAALVVSAALAVFDDPPGKPK
jgi:hypothetical protein